MPNRIVHLTEQEEMVIRLAKMVAVMDDDWVTKWAASFGLVRKLGLFEETMSEFRARCIDTMSKCAPYPIDPLLETLMSGYEINVVTGEIDG